MSSLGGAAIALVSVALATAAIGCAKKPIECRAVIEAIDQDDAEIKAISSHATSDAKELAPLVRRAARVEDKLSTQLETTTVTTKPLGVLVAQYESFAHELAQTADAMADVLERLAKMRDEADALVVERDAALAKLKTRCMATRSASCRRLDDATRALDAVGEDDAYPEQATKVMGVATAIKALHLADHELEEDAATYAGVLAKDAALLDDLAGVAPKVADSQDALGKAIAKEQPLTDDINLLCVGHK